MNASLSNDSLKQLFSEARTHHAWSSKTVSEETLHALYDLGKWGPTSVNGNPGRLIFVKSAAAKELLYPALMGSNVEQVKTAPITVIVCQDNQFHHHLLKLFPAFDAKGMFESAPAMIEPTAFRNSSLQGAYFMIAARAMGLDVGPMSGFDNAKVDEAFLKGTAWKSNFLFNLGYGDHEKLFPRGPRLSFDEACKIV